MWGESLLFHGLQGASYLSEQEAYHYIRKLSQLKGLSMRRVAEMILVKGGG